MRNPFSSTCCAFGRLRRWLRSVFFYEHWMIGIVDQPIANAVTWKEAPPIDWIAPFNRRRYIADPFAWPGRPDMILCEEYRLTDRLGRILALQIGAGGIVSEQPADFPIPGHLSFPQVFAHDGQVYAMPESCWANRLEILRWEEKDQAWVPFTTVFDGLAVADAILFRKDGLFWIAYTDVRVHPHDNLNLVYSHNLTGPWVEHSGNPVQRGRERSRGAGAMFEASGKLYRPAQDCSRVYGGAVRIMEIVTCTTERYEEREAAFIAPTSRDYPDGFHTLSAWGDKCLVDGMRLTFSPLLVWNKLARRLRHIF